MHQDPTHRHPARCLQLPAPHHVHRHRAQAAGGAWPIAGGHQVPPRLPASPESQRRGPGHLRPRRPQNVEPLRHSDLIPVSDQRRPGP